MYDSFMTKVTDRPNWDTPVKLDSEIDLWEQQDGETVEQFAAFRAYLELIPRANPQTRALGARRIAELDGADIPLPPAHPTAPPGRTQFSLRHLKRMARRYSWEDRAKAWDWSKNETLQGILDRRRLVLLRNRLELVGEIGDMALGALRAMEPERWRPRDALAALQLAKELEDGLMSMTQLGGPEQPPQMVAASQFSLSVGASEALEAHTVELVEELQRRQALAAAPQPEAGA